MSPTVVSRTVRSIPFRDGGETWALIVDLLTQGGQNTHAAQELQRVAGFASSIIADGAPKDAPIIVQCDGPRTRLYCVYDDDSLDESLAEEDALGFDALNGTWTVSLPCLSADLKWMRPAIEAVSTRVHVRDAAEGISLPEPAAKAAAAPLTLDIGALYK